MLDRYPLHDLLVERRPALGLILNLAAPAMVEIGSLMGFDFVMIDAEHGPVGPAEAEPMIRAAELARMAPLVRVPSSEPHIALRYLDLGAVGIVFPHVSTAEAARKCVEAVLFPPAGKRGVAPSTNAAGYNTRMPFKEYLKHANRVLLPMVIIEEPEAVENIDEIVKVEGLAVIVLGAMDLSAAMGHPGDPGAPAVEAAVEKVIASCKAAGIPLCLGCGSVAQGRDHLAKGASMLFTPLGSWLASYGKVFTDDIRKGA